MPRCWVVGPIAWDWPYAVQHIPASGESVQGARQPGRLGGTGANVARALASRNVPVALVGYVGTDEFGNRSTDDLQSRGVNTSYITRIDGPTSQVLLLVDRSGQRTIVGVVPDLLAQVHIPIDEIAEGDLVYFAAWRDQFWPAILELSSRGSIVATVPFPEQGSQVPVSVILGAYNELPPEARDAPWRVYTDWTGSLVHHVLITLGEGGVDVFSRNEGRRLQARAAKAIDCTGAGDAFAAAVLMALLGGDRIEAGVEEGLLWGARAVETAASIPPPWSSVI